MRTLSTALCEVTISGNEHCPNTASSASWRLCLWQVFVHSPGDSLKNYMCNGSLQSNTTLVLGAGEHRGPLGCLVSDVSNVTILGSNSGESTILGEGLCGIMFKVVQNLTIENITFAGCNGSDVSPIIYLRTARYVSLRHCTFQNSPRYSAVSNNSGNIDISYCTFQKSTAIFLNGSTATVTISHCTFQNNMAKIRYTCP